MEPTDQQNVTISFIEIVHEAPKLLEVLLPLALKICRVCQSDDFDSSTKGRPEAFAG